MKRQKPRTLRLGSVSTGTLRPEDLIPSFLDEAESLRLPREERKIVRAIRKAVHDADDESAYWDEDADGDLDDLFGILENHVPDFCTFGAHEGDGSDFGVWPALDLHDHNGLEAEGIHISPDAPSTREHSHWLQVSDHGNATLYRRAGNRWLECWSIV